MIIDEKCRALQHLLVQGFTLYTTAAAVGVRLLDSGILDNPEHAWAIQFDRRSLEHTSRLPESDPLRATFADAAVRSAAPDAQHVVCHTQGALLMVPLKVADVRTARMRIEAAIALGKAPPAERLEAFPDELIEREAARRVALRAQPSSEET